MSKKKIIAITGTRSDYGPMRPVYRKIIADPDFNFGLIVTGMHLLPEYGLSIQEIEKDYFPILRKVSMLLGEDTNSAMVKSLGLAIYGIAEALEDLQPDIVLLQGDRGEMLAAAIGAAHQNIPIVHMSGGDFSGSIDDSIRNAITKFAHIHLVTCDQSAKQVTLMGEEPSRIAIVGEPTLDVIRSFLPHSLTQLEHMFNLDLSLPLILTTQHPVTYESQYSADQMRETLEALTEIGEQTVFIYPNSDAGNRAMVKIIEQYTDCDHIRFLRSIPHDTYLSLMKHASVMVGNSSSGIIEAPAFKLPVVNIGTRQNRRVRACNVIDVRYDRKEILCAIQTALSDNNFKKSCKDCVNPYGDGHTADRVVSILKNLQLTPKLLAKWLPITPLQDK